MSILTGESLVTVRDSLHKLMSSLKSWLAASQKKHCEICGYKYNFTKGESMAEMKKI